MLLLNLHPLATMFMFLQLIMIKTDASKKLWLCIFVALCVLILWPLFDVILAHRVSVVIPLWKLKKSMKVVFYCHFLDLLLAQHTTVLWRLYRKPIDFIEEITTG
ncbi:uncharacterized protein LOC133703696 [Populus nigra]|uniref:uncharacterized protein LOC133703696 n=1 Tax=Populus nigra TaxID=3691 RepID=UPI002B2744D0|nr:uncharacterized protein LOC133703696 [Populus nigra]